MSGVSCAIFYIEFSFISFHFASLFSVLHFLAKAKINLENKQGDFVKMKNVCLRRLCKNDPSQRNPTTPLLAQTGEKKENIDSLKVSVTWKFRALHISVIIL